MATDSKSGSAALRVNVVTPRGVIAEAETDAVTAPGALGELEVLPGHIPFLTTLHPGVLILGESKKRVFAVSRGYLRVSQTGVVEILVEQATPGDKVDGDAARSARDQAGAELEAWKDRPQDAEWQNIKDRHDWAQAQLDARDRARA
jgi:F-type H+-transporting ATPase subunit epsilon